MYSSTVSSTSALDGVGGQRHAPADFPPGKRFSAHCTGGWVDLRAGVDESGKSYPHRDLISEPSSPYKVAIPTELCRAKWSVE